MTFDLCVIGVFFIVSSIILSVLSVCMIHYLRSSCVYSCSRTLLKNNKLVIFPGQARPIAINLAIISIYLSGLLICLPVYDIWAFLFIVSGTFIGSGII